MFNSKSANPRQALSNVRQLPPPADFNRDARDLWSAAQRQLRAQGTWERTDRPLLEMYVRNLVAARHARETADLYQHSSAIEQRASIKTAQDAEAAAFALAKVLLLTPEARKRHGINGPKAVGSELDALVG
jgi:phage terminase small subunit